MVLISIVSMFACCSALAFSSRQYFAATCGHKHVCRLFSWLCVSYCRYHAFWWCMPLKYLNITVCGHADFAQVLVNGSLINPWKIEPIIFSYAFKAHVNQITNVRIKKTDHTSKQKGFLFFHFLLHLDWFTTPCKMSEIKGKSCKKTVFTGTCIVLVNCCGPKKELSLVFLSFQLNCLIKLHKALSLLVKVSLSSWWRTGFWTVFYSVSHFAFGLPCNILFYLTAKWIKNQFLV